MRHTVHTPKCCTEILIGVPRLDKLYSLNMKLSRATPHIPPVDPTITIKKSQLRSLSDLPPLPRTLELLASMQGSMLTYEKRIMKTYANLDGVDWIEYLKKVPETFTMREWCMCVGDALDVGPNRLQKLLKEGMLKAKKVGKYNIYTKTNKYPEKVLLRHKERMEALDE